MGNKFFEVGKEAAYGDGSFYQSAYAITDAFTTTEQSLSALPCSHTSN